MMVLKINDAVKNFREKDITEALRPLLAEKEPYLLRVISTIEFAFKSGYELVKNEDDLK